MARRWSVPDTNRFILPEIPHGGRQNETSIDVNEKNLASISACKVLHGGLYWTRTSDPIDVNDVLYQLSQQTKSLGTKHSIALGRRLVNPEFQFFVRNPYASFFMAGFVL